MPSAIDQRLAAVRERIAVACRRAGRDPAEVTLVAVSKTRPIDDIAAAARLGQCDFGENRVQEAERKVHAGLPAEIRLHLVGHLQRNKARVAARIFDCIHSIGDIDLLQRLDAAAARPLAVLAQVDLGKEPTKHGLAVEDLPALLLAAEKLAHVELRGLMCLPPFLADREQVRPFFRRLAALRDEHGGKGRLPHLSMGMSHDFEVAIEEGATMVRVGEAIFGPRGKVA